MNTAGSLGLVFAIHLGGELQPRLTTGHSLLQTKLRVPRWCWDRSSRPVARFRPLPTCHSCGPCGWQLAIFARAPGLPPTG